MEDRANILREMKICRFCLCNDESVLTNIYERQKAESKFSLPLPLQIMACSAIEVFKNDGMPQQICNSCRTLTLQAYAFKTNCKKADDALKVFLATGQLSKPFIQNIEPMQVPKDIPKLPKVLNHEQPAKKAKTLKERSDQGAEIIKLMINNDEINMEKELPDIELEESSMEYDDEEIEDGEEMRNIDHTEFDADEASNCSTSNTNNQLKTDCFPCPHCERAFPLKQLLDLHVTNHSRYRDFECGDCSKKFFTKYDLSKHLATHAEEKLFSCLICNKSFARESLLKRHEEKVHKDVQKYECEECGKAFLTQSYLRDHMEKHKKKRPFTCHVCNKSFVFRQGLERHLVVHDENKPHKCNYCEASFNSAIKLARHITSHAGLRPYPCKICNRTFLLSHHLTRHMRSHYAMQSSSIEAAIHQHKCDICSMSFRRKDSLINHSAIHSMVNLRCVICNTSFATAQLVKEHITTHLAGLPFPCEKCDYSFETLEQLEEHELKHAEMEYEEQIEKEVINEALSKGEAQKTDEEVTEKEDTNVTSYTIEDFDESEISIIPRKTHTSKAGPSQQINMIQDDDSSNGIQEYIEQRQRGVLKKVRVIDEEQVHSSNYAPFLKDEVDSDVEESGISQEAPQQEEPQETPKEDIEPIKPIVRQEGTKVYQRKAPVERKIPEILPEAIKPVSEEPPQVQDTSTVRVRDLSPTTLSSLQTKKVVDMKMGNKIVKVQKFIITKEEMKAMAKQGILEIKNGKVVLKNAGHPILNATLKPIRKTEIESLLEKKTEPRMQLKQYQKKTEKATGGGRVPEETRFLENSVTSENIDLDTSFIDASQTTIQTDN